MLYYWCKKENIARVCFNGWFREFCQIMREETNSLKLKYSKDLNHKSVFQDKDASEELSYLHEHFVLSNYKATKNVAIICKHFYLNNIINECKTNAGITVVNDQPVIVINDNIHNFINDIGIKDCYLTCFLVQNSVNPL